MKRTVYIFAFILLGTLLQFLLHAGLEIWYVGLLLKDFPRYGLGLTWGAWFAIHHIGAVLLLAVGAAFGYWQGRYWWRRIYEEHAVRRFSLGF